MGTEIKLEKKVNLDLNGMSREDIKKLCLAEGYSKTTYYNALKRKSLKVTAVKQK